MANDYKQKYLSMRAKMIEIIDVSWRKGYETGIKEAEVMAMQQQIQDLQGQLQGAMGQPGDPAQDPQAMMEELIAQGMSPEQAQAEVEAMMAQQQSGAPEGEGAPVPGQEDMVPEEQAGELDAKIEELQRLVAKGEKPSVLDMRKAVEGIADLRKNQKQILAGPAKVNSSSQKKLVDNILQKWEDESKQVTSDIDKIIQEHEVNTEK